jgi:hypothetical protein
VKDDLVADPLGREVIDGLGQLERGGTRWAGTGTAADEGEQHAAQQDCADFQIAKKSVHAIIVSITADAHPSQPSILNYLAGDFDALGGN